METLAGQPLLERVRAVVAAAAEALEAQRQRIDDLNVYPVPDGDTGRNLSETVGAVRVALSEHGETNPAAIARAIKQAALMGARGNSGIILSQIVRGASDALAEVERLDGTAVAAALRGASDAAYRAVQNPQEGTILTVIREMAEEAEAYRDADLLTLLDRIVARGDDAVRRTPELLAVLRDAGVVDAGGAGLVELVRGVVAALAGRVLESAISGATVAPSAADLHAEPSEFRYCTSFLVNGGAVDIAGLRTQLSPLGDCLVVVGDEELAKVHVHTDDPGRALSIATTMGGLGGVEIADMHAQIVERAARIGAGTDVIEHQPCDIVFVVAGDGIADLARSTGARVIVAGGQTMNPSTAELVAAIDRCSSDEVVVLPNNANVILAAQAAAANASRPAVVVPTRSVPAGLAALLAFLPDRSASANADVMTAAARDIATGELTRAVRAATIDGIAVADGDHLALVDDRAVAAGVDLATIVGQLLDAVTGGGERTFVTVLVGAEATGGDAALAALEQAAAGRDGFELDVHDGGQPHYALLLSAE